MADFEYDLLVVGGGSGGVGAARRAAEHGARVALIEGAELGGTCVHRGCIPKKLLVYAAEFGVGFGLSKAYGWAVDSSFDWPAMVEAKTKELKRLGGFYNKSLESAGVVHIEGWGVLSGAHEVTVGGRKVTAERILLAVGSRPWRPQFPGVEHTITSREAFDLPAFPKKVLTIGSGYIGVEFAGIFSGLGAETHIMFRSDYVLPDFDQDVRQHLQEEMQKAGVLFHAGDRVTEIRKQGEMLHCTTQKGQQLEFDQVLMATGRVPRTENIGLEEVGVELGAKGAVKVNEQFQTSVPSIYAIGDCIDRVQLTPVAIREGRHLAEVLYNNSSLGVDYDKIPTAVFSRPPVGTVGMTQNKALATAPDGVEIYRAKFRPMKYTLPDKDTKALLKLIVCRKSRKVLGAHMVGEGAAELVQALAVCLVAGATKEDFDNTIAVHPTTAEEFVLMRHPSETLTSAEEERKKKHTLNA